MFPRAIPLLRAGYIRVTHPCAGRPRIATGLPLDLHVLGLPLAFILSQDQTLRSIMFFSPVPLQPLSLRETFGYVGPVCPDDLPVRIVCSSGPLPTSVQ